MRIAQGVDVKLAICDIETMPCLLDIGILDPDKQEWIEFEVSAYKNDLWKWCTFYQEKHFDYMVTFNGIGFDQQVLQYVLHKYQDWYDLTNLEITQKVYEFVQSIIENQKYEIPLKYNEFDFPMRPIDLFRIHHFDNKAKRTSLKWCAYMLNLPVAEMPLHHSTKEISENERDMVIGYRRNDCRVTEGLLQITLGNTELPELKSYQGKNKIQDRFDVQAQTGLDCLNWSDVKIGEEWNKLDYKNAEGVTDDRDLFPKKIVQPFGQPFKNFFPKSLEFKTKNLQNFAEMFGNEKVRADKKGSTKKQEYKVKVGNTTYTIAKGGIHSNEKHRAIIPPPGWITRDADVGSQYPWAVAKWNVKPEHLTGTVTIQFRDKIGRRIEFKGIGKKLKAEGKEVEARPYMGIQEMLKLCLNGGYYGKLNQRGSWIEYPEGTLKVTIGCQMEILMLIEALEEAGISVISGNTDGIVSQFPKEKEEIYKKICKEWEHKIGNDVFIGDTQMGALEFQDFKALWQESINHYIGLQADGKVKKKGRFMTDFELHKNKSKRIIPLAMEAYFIDKKDPIQFILDHKNIYDFCIGRKGNEDLYWEEQWFQMNGETKLIKRRRHTKVICYYIAKEGTTLFKRGVDHKGKKVNSYAEASDKDFPWLGKWQIKTFNEPFEAKIEEYGINYDYYIIQTLKRIDKIERTKKAQRYADSLKAPQLSIF